MSREVRPDLYARSPQARFERLNTFGFGVAEIAVLEELRGKPDIKWTARLVEQSIRQTKPSLKDHAAAIPATVKTLIASRYLQSDEHGQISVNELSIEYYRQNSGREIIPKGMLVSVIHF